MEENSIRDVLISLGLCDDNSIEEFYPSVRDKDGVSVLRCRRSGIIFLNKTSHIDLEYFRSKKSYEYWSSTGRKETVMGNLEDDTRRAESFKHLIAGKKWLDIGTGCGGMLDILAPLSLSCAAVEPQEHARAELIKSGYNVYPDISQITENNFDVITMFHVFEHLTDPIATLNFLFKKMATGGRLIIEVPHARDFLISFLCLDSFLKFTFRSDHLILHTRESLASFIKEAGFANIIINGYQRYPLANHLYWLNNGKPGGHLKWSPLRNPEIDSAYSNLLNNIDKTDTLIASAEKQ
ncbi:MAG: class I SAM-dependent methyltransferase [Nitrospirae bacterium YQR-1]